VKPLEAERKGPKMQTKTAAKQMQLDGIDSENEARRQLGKIWLAKIQAEVFTENKMPLEAESRGAE